MLLKELMMDWPSYSLILSTLYTACNRQTDIIRRVQQRISVFSGTKFYSSIFLETCIVLPQHVNKFSFMCSLQRRIDLNLENLFYKLTTPSDKPLAYPKETSNVLKAVSFPLLNQPTDKLLLRSALKPRLREAGWLIHYLGMTRRNRELIKKTLENPNIQPFTNYSNYAQLLKSYREEQSKDLVSIKIPGVVRIFCVCLRLTIRVLSKLFRTAFYNHLPSKFPLNIIQLIKCFRDCLHIVLRIVNID